MSAKHSEVLEGVWLPNQPNFEASPTFAEAGYNPDTVRPPVYYHREEIIEALRNNQVLIVMAETGTGKSTQIPQICLEAGYEDITLSQPRIRAALNVERRIKFELGQELGVIEAEHLVSCQTSEGLEGPKDAPIKVVTDGLHLVRDAFDRRKSGPDVLIIDEIHEWNANMDPILPLALERAQRDPQFRLMIMSATLNPTELTKHVKGEFGIDPAVVQIEGRMHKVDWREEPKSTVAKEAVKAARDIFNNPEAKGASNTIQIFVAGKEEIKDTIDELRATLPSEILAKTRLAALHAQMTIQDQEPAYEDVKDGIKIVVETKMGQTSVTIPRTRYVITSGLERRTELDDDGDEKGLLLRAASQDDLRQQAGRTGRTNEGIFILTRQNHRTPFIGFEKRAKRPLPEIKRIHLDRMVLLTACGDRDLRYLKTLNRAPFKNIQRARRRLRLMGALGEDGRPTGVGRRMNAYSLSPASARSMVHAESFAPNVRAYMALIAAAKEVGGIRSFERGSDRRWEVLSQETSSDDLAQLDAFLAALSMTPQQLYEHDFSINNLHKAEKYFRKATKQAGVSPDIELKPPTLEEREQLRECILVGSVNDVFLPAGEGLWRLMGNSLKLRELSNRSLIKAIGSVIVGDPRLIEIKRDGKPEIKYVIEDATTVSIEALGRVATHFISRESTGYRLRGDNQFVRVEVEYIAGRKLSERELPAEPSPQLREIIMEHVKNHPGENLRKLRDIKKTLEELNQKSKFPLNLLRDQDINAWIEAATPADITYPWLIDDNLGRTMQLSGVSLEKYVSPEELQAIEDNAPQFISAGDVTFELRYVNHRPIVKRYSIDDIAGLEGDICLPDGRPVIFYYQQGKRLRLSQLQNRLRAEGRL